VTVVTRGRRGTARRLGVVVLTLVGGLLGAPAYAVSPLAAPSPSGPAAPGTGHRVVAPSPPPQLPQQTVFVEVTPDQGSVIGVAYPLTAHFSAPIAHHAIAEAHMPVFVNGAFSRGAWFWRNATTAVFRQASFWPARAHIDVRLSLAGVELGRTPTYRIVGSSTSTRGYSVRTSRSLVAYVDGKSDRMVVRIDGAVVKNFGVSLGKTGFETRSGIKAVMEKYVSRHMTSIAAGITDPKDQYDVVAPYSVRITPTGEFVHGAPWAAARIGRWNGSHGCTNLLTDDAHWFFDHVLPGDPVITTGTNRPMDYWNGTGAPFNMPWSLWLAGSALKGARV